MVCPSVPDQPDVLPQRQGQRDTSNPAGRPVDLQLLTREVAAHLPAIVRRRPQRAAAGHDDVRQFDGEPAMIPFILKRLGSGIIVLFVVSALTFFLLYASSGSIARNILGDQATPEQVAQKEAELGLGQPVIVRY